MKVNIYNIKNNGKRKYAHFDKRLGLKEAYKYVSNPENIKNIIFIHLFIMRRRSINLTKKKESMIRQDQYAMLLI